MSKRMLRSVLAAALSAVVVLGAASGLAGKSSDVRADTGSITVVVGGTHTDDTSWN
jgi:ABC-type glycerol-3-phosphate transport system substrate-binding protein